MNKLPRIILLFYPIALLTVACNNSPAKEDSKKNNTNSVVQPGKPPATYQDTLTISFPAAVFYHADSLQLQKIKALTGEGTFEAQMHEYFFQMRNARIVLNRERKNIKTAEAKNIRFLLFIKNNKDSVCIDLDTKNDPYGLFLFDGKKEPGFIDMMNIETQLNFYFDK